MAARFDTNILAVQCHFNVRGAGALVIVLRVIKKGTRAQRVGSKQSDTVALGWATVAISWRFATPIGLLGRSGLKKPNEKGPREIILHSHSPTPTRAHLQELTMSGDGQVGQVTASTLIPSRLVSLDARADDEIETSLHNLPKPLMREFGHVFNDEYLKFEGGEAVDASALTLLAIPTNQRAREDLVAIGDHIEAEKDRLLNVVSDSRPQPLGDALLCC